MRAARPRGILNVSSASSSCKILCWLVVSAAGLGACASSVDGSPPLLGAASKPDALSVADVHCGACPDRPGAKTSCVGSTCVYSCLEGRADCDGKAANGCEVDKLASTANCGTCGHVCPGGANGTARCKAGECQFDCDSGWADCLPGKDGCETSTASDPAHCGDCTIVCPGGPHAKTRCQDSTCGLECDGGWANCDNLPASGCDIDVTSDGENCGLCNFSCQGTKCVKSSCECASASSTAQVLPLDMYIMMDQSGSMADPTGTGLTKWKSIAKAISGFVADPSTAGIGVGIQYFPQSGVGSGFFGGSKDSCTVSDYAKPEVEIAPLPENSTAVAASIAKHGPGGSTPTSAALQGAIDYAKSHAASNPTHTVIVVLATDGIPSECMPMDIPGIAAIAAKAASGTPPIRTFVIGVGAALKALGAIASSGGSGAAFVVDEGGDVVQQFEATLKAVQVTALACTYAIPLPEKGKTFDPQKVNVQVTFGKNAASVIPYVGSVSQCDPGLGGWYYDDPQMPTKIQLCANICSSIGALADAKVEILVGCSRTTKGQ